MTKPDLFAGISEAKFQLQVLELARYLGWMHYHTFDSRRSVAGFPDLVLVKPPRIVWAEIKSARGQLSRPQATWLHNLRACGAEVYLWRPADWETLAGILRQREAP